MFVVLSVITVLDIYMDSEYDNISNSSRVFIEFPSFFLGPKSEIGFCDGNLAEDILSPLFFWFCEGISPI